MDSRTLLDFLSLAEKLKCNTRHSWTSTGRRESVAEHTFRLLVFAWLVKEEFLECDMDRVMELCLFHDIGEAVTGDIPAFEKTDSDEQREAMMLDVIADKLPEPCKKELKSIFKEIIEKQTDESKLLQALDKLETVIQHNEAPIETWLPLEYDLQLTYGQQQVEDIPYMCALKKVIDQDTRDKIEREGWKKCGKMSGFHVSADREKISLKRVEELFKQSYWAKGRDIGQIRLAMENSRAYGVYDEKEYMVGYARVITDCATTFYLCDVIIDETYRHKGLGKLLMEKIMDDVGHLHGMLHTKDAVSFYEKYGFHVVSSGEEMLMEKER